MVEKGMDARKILKAGGEINNNRKTVLFLLTPLYFT